MKKFIAAIDGLRFSESNVLYATRMASQSHAHLTGIFLDDFSHHSYKIYEMVSDTATVEEKRIALEEQDLKTRQNSVSRFQEYCNEAAIDFNLHSDRNFAIEEILHESIYADILFVNARETFMAYLENPPTKFMRTLLSHSECPVFITPYIYEPVRKVVFLYDGGPSSVHAIRMFSYLLPSLRSLDMEVISVKPDSDGLVIPDKRLMTEFMERHFPAASYTILKGIPESAIFDKLKLEKPGTLVVLGAYKRSMVSRWFRPSMADLLMEKLNLPLFIAHS